MKFSQLRTDRDYFTGKLSDIARQLDLAGLAIIWIFRTGGPGSGGITYDQSLIWPMLFLVGSLALDLLHYGFSSAAWDYVFRKFDKQKKADDDDVRFSARWSFVARIFFWGKVSCTVMAYGLLISFIGHRL